MAEQTLSSASVNKILQGTNAAAANTNAVPANSDKSLAVYDKNGTLIGYVPVFTTEW
jgi:hypothetical protein